MSQRKLPPLDLLPAFEAAARHLSFTRAASELFLTQSAVSRQIQALEEALGVDLFQRRHRALLLTDAGQLFYRSAADVLRQMQETTQQIRGDGPAQPLIVSTLVSFASLWLVPRLPRFRALRPSTDVRISANNELVDLARERIDVAIRYCAPRVAPAGATKLFGEEVMPVCSPALLRDRKKPLRTPADLRHHVLLHDYDPLGRTPWLDWDTWFQSQGIAGLRPAGDVRFSHYDQMIHAAVSGQGVGIGRLPMLADMIRRGQLVMPFARSAAAPGSTRAFFLVTEARAAQRPEVQAFVQWLQAEASGDEKNAAVIGRGRQKKAHPPG